jgi:hypothetical protein
MAPPRQNKQAADDNRHSRRGSDRRGGSGNAPGRQTNDLLAELAGRLAADGRMDAEMLKMVVQEMHQLRYRVISGRTDLTLGL